tara:strand:+ start:84 stop:701 length:618 start_codon:yes stop_codon:yes gene_type:complete
MNLNIKIFNNDLPSDIDLSKEKTMMVDCEALGLETKRDPLTLVQIATENKDCYIIKLNRLNYDCPNLVKVFSSDATFVFHYARQDLAWLSYYLKVEIKNVWCSKIASKIVRTFSSNHGYKDLVKELCGKDISKKEQTSDWGDPNLTEKQIKYAAQDTEYLLEIKEKLSNMLIRENRMDLFTQSVKCLPTIVKLDLAGYKMAIYEH